MKKPACIALVCCILALAGCSREAAVSGVPAPLPPEDSFARQPASDAAEQAKPPAPRPSGKAAPEPSRSSPRPEEPPLLCARLIAAGDIMIMANQIRAAKTGADYDFFPAFEHIAPYIGTADIAIANLETNIAGEDLGFSVSGDMQEDGTKAPSYFNAPKELLGALKQAGFNVLTTANNHTLDKGTEGLRRTIESIRAEGLGQTGTFLPGDNRFLLLDANGISVAVLAYTFSTNKNTGGLSSAQFREAVNILDKKRALADIAAAREAGAELVILSLHWGVEFAPEPTTDQTRLAKSLIEGGADVIVGSHPHVLQRMERVKAGGREGIVAYSMGNFLSNMSDEEHSLSAILVIDAEKGDTGLNLRAAYLPALCRSVAHQRSVLPAAPSALEGMDPRLAPLKSDLNGAYAKILARVGDGIPAVR